MNLFKYFFLLISLAACQPQENKTNFTKMNTFPFKVLDNETHTIIVECEGEAYPTHNPIFEKHEFSGNGYSWEGVIRHILNEKAPELLAHIDFDPEAGGFYAYADSAENQRKIIDVLLPICSDLKQFDACLSKIDPEEMDD